MANLLPKLLPLACALMLWGCSKPPKHQAKPAPANIDLTGYDTSCKTAADCVLVDPNRCAICSCTSSPISAHEEARFNAAVGELRCPPPDPNPDVACGGCPGFRPACVDGACKAEQY